MNYGLGRRVEHDPQSRRYAARRATQARTVLWEHRAPVLHQGTLGACTGFALAQCLNTTRFVNSRPQRRYLTSAHGRNLYSKATSLDQFPGQWPPTDTGSSSLGVCKAGMVFGYLSGYDHAFGLSHALSALSLSPMITGTAWHDAMFEPDSNGFIVPAGGVVGGHEYLVLGCNVPGRYITILNSWGPSWGRNGRAKIRWDHYDELLQDYGDATVPIGIRQ